MVTPATVAGDRSVAAWRVEVACALAVLTTATSAIMVREAQNDGVGSLWLAALRLCFASLIVLPFAFTRLAKLSSRALWPTIGSGTFLALHFAAWISSLEHTSVLVSGVLVSTAPIFVALAAPWFTGDRLSRTGLLGVFVAFAGAVAIVLGAPSTEEAAGRNDLLGAALATLGALAMSGHLMIGRRVRRELDLLTYLGVIYPVAALWLLAMAGAIEGAVPAIGSAWFFGLAMALGPQLLGHSTFNWALRHLPAPRVAAIILLEPVGAAILAFLILSEIPRPLQALGALAILIGVGLEVCQRQKR